MSRRAQQNDPVRPNSVINKYIPINPNSSVDVEGGVAEGVAEDAGALGEETLDAEGQWEPLSGDTAPRVSRGPREPSRIERERHEVTHLPPRSWCVHCRRGRSIASAHHAANSDRAHSVPIVSIDYAYLGKLRKKAWSDIDEPEKENQKVKQ